MIGRSPHQAVGPPRDPPVRFHALEQVVFGPGHKEPATEPLPILLERHNIAIFRSVFSVIQHRERARRIPKRIVGRYIFDQLTADIHTPSIPKALKVFGSSLEHALCL